MSVLARPRRHEARRPPVVAHRQVRVVGLQRGRGRAEEAADGVGVVVAGVEVGVVADGHGEVHRDVAEGAQVRAQASRFRVGAPPEIAEVARTWT